MSDPASLPQRYFDELYARTPDPWGLATRDYEQRKYVDTVAALDARRFACGVEVGCAIGELTAHLAGSCDALLGVDIAEAALQAARRRNAGSSQVRFARMALPRETPDGRFDLIVLSEVLYYFGRSDLAQVADWTRQSLEPGGVVLLVHWLGETPDYPLTGDEAVDGFLRAATPTLTTDRRWRRESYRLDRLVRAGRGDEADASPE